MRLLICLFFFTLVVGCGDTGGGQTAGSLIDHELWRETDAGTEFFGVAPPGKGCSDDPEVRTWLVEVFAPDTVLSVYSDFCDWITLEHETLLPIMQGSTVQIRFYHFDLTAPSGSEANVGLAIGDELVWEQAFLIPNMRGFTTFEWVATKDFPEDTPLLFHVDNHGNNEYLLVDVNVL